MIWNSSQDGRRQNLTDNSEHWSTWKFSNNTNIRMGTS